MVRSIKDQRNKGNHRRSGPTRKSKAVESKKQ